MKIAFVYDAAYPWVKGGAEKRVYELAKRLAAHDHEVHWYSMGYWWPEHGKKDMEMDGIHLHGVSSPVELYQEDRRSIKEAIYFALMILFKLRAGKYDLIDCQGFPFFSCFSAKFNSLLGRSTLVITLHEVWNNYWYEYLGRAGFFGKLIERMMVNLTKNIITVSSKTKKDLSEIKKQENSIIIPNGIDLKEIETIQPSPNKTDILFVGRLIKEKNADLLIKSLNKVKDQHPNIRCSIIGEGPEEEKLVKLTSKLNLQSNINFMGFLDDYSKVISHMKSSEMLVLPSSREGFGMVVLEANACGIPAIVVDHPMNAAKDLITPGKNGFVADATEESLSKNILMGMKSKKEISRYCQEMASEYDWDKIVKKLEITYFNFLLKKEE
ncbi:MAG TPA: glycosyltransferase family 4 protein [Methanobacterium sp.]|nr:glycosyltransferase family 4 protein [Methanobacterium sp.]